MDIGPVRLSICNNQIKTIHREYYVILSHFISAASISGHFHSTAPQPMFIITQLISPTPDCSATLQIPNTQLMLALST